MWIASENTQPAEWAPRTADSTSVLVTGGAGFIGSALVRQLLDSGRRVVVVDDLSSGRLSRLPEHRALEFFQADLCQPGCLNEQLGAGRNFEAVFHLAARVGVRAVLRDPEGCRSGNLAAVKELMSYLAGLPEGNRGRLFAASTSEVYRDRCEPLLESDALREVDGVGRWAYAASKVRAEQLIDSCAQLWSAAVQPVHLRFFNVVGPGQDSVGGMVLPAFIERARAAQPLKVHGVGEEVRTFAHVREVSQTLLALLESSAVPAGALNIGGSARTQIRDLARLVLEHIPGNAGLEFVDPRVDCGAGFEGIGHREPDLNRLRSCDVPVPALDLVAIVQDCVLHHRSEVNKATDERQRPEPHSPCASPVS